MTKVPDSPLDLLRDYTNEIWSYWLLATQGQSLLQAIQKNRLRTFHGYFRKTSEEIRSAARKYAKKHSSNVRLIYALVNKINNCKNEALAKIFLEITLQTLASMCETAITLGDGGFYFCRSQ